VVDLGPEPWTFLPGGRPPAPGRLRLVQAFVNTTNLESGQDAIADPDGLARWADTMGLAPGAFTEDDVRRALELREGLRGMLMANAGHGDGHEGAAAFEHAARAAHLTLTVTGVGVELRPQAPGIDGVLGGVLTACHHAQLDGTWPRLKACRRDVCGWAYYDRSRNRSGAWCAMSICGNRTKTRSYRRRRP
jgi:predicted RNA-binding Zn ribbon-like protein